jgi:glutamyl-tRNA synthetase
MPEQEDFDLETLLKKYALQNALRYNGKANANAVLGKVLAEQPTLRDNINEIKSKISDIIDLVNSQSLSLQKEELFKLAPDLIDKKKEPVKERILQELKNVGDKVVMRFAPGPSGPLHIGHARAAVLNDEYCKKYDGKLILRLEDTNPVKILPEAYDMIKEDLDWLGVKYHEVVVQSDRFDIYYKYARELLENEHAYICTCDVEDWRDRKSKGQACKDRKSSSNENLERWQKMLDGTFGEGEASYIIKTDLNHPNPAIRDFIAFRIIDKPQHLRTKDKYRVYPLMNFSVAIDDHLLGLTHVLRGKDHLNNTYRQGYLHNYLKWTRPEYIHYGWVSIEDTILKTSEITGKISKGEIGDWTDVRLGTFRALSARGIEPDAIRKYWIEVGTKEVDMKFSWETLYAFNRDIVDAKAPRYFFVPEPVQLSLRGKSELEGHAPTHPSYPERGVRKVKLSADTSGEIPIYLSAKDWGEVKGEQLFRLKDLCNVKPLPEKVIEYQGDELSELRKVNGKIVQWVSGQKYLNVNLIMPDGEIVSGYGEHQLRSALGELVQLERIGFAKIYDSTKIPVLSYQKKLSVNPEDIWAIYTHK